MAFAGDAFGIRQDIGEHRPMPRLAHHQGHRLGVLDGDDLLAGDEGQGPAGAK